MLRKGIWIFVGLMLILEILVTGCGKKTERLEKEEKLEKEELKISVWVAYWDIDRVLHEVRDLEEHIENFSYFAAYFNHKNQLMIPENTTEIFQIIQENFSGNDWVNYLTIVNDKMKENGSSSLKDTEVLYALFSNDEKMNKHIDEIISIALIGGYEGIEIDYEAIKKDMELWKMYLKFCQKLYIKTSENDLKMRVVLEPSAPIEKLTLPKGPDYIMMCYNLYGTATEAGPKADEKFIKGLIKKMSIVPGNKGFALATGGFDWKEDGETNPVSEIQAEEIVKQYKAEIERDEKSQCIKFVYKDIEGEKHEVWYADTVTLHYWMAIIAQSGENVISIWRLGGNNSEKMASGFK
ncbi:glycoside hydrolase family 18 protein [Vallitalea maricola]|uniref:Uncharacterized protein n=1 Tax=Vallitalea maricola TaxID=3074433 RepID=A0ACB5UHF5_9FIRM|nr:hypothetical protein AN2V17_12040 [Vallitalea sp. AN17-2]